MPTELQLTADGSETHAQKIAKPCGASASLDQPSTITGLLQLTACGSWCSIENGMHLPYLTAVMSLSFCFEVIHEAVTEGNACLLSIYIKLQR